MRVFPCLAATGVLFVWASSQAFSATPHEPGHSIVNPQDIVWSDVPTSLLPAGAQMAVLQGNIAETGPFTMRLKFPANYYIPPHYHGTDEAVTIISGSAQIGFGETFQASALTFLPEGGFTFLPAKQPHFLKTGDEEMVLQINSPGPFTITYIGSNTGSASSPVQAP